jgi:general secretion pathway protein E
MGIEPFLVASSLVGLLAQRLGRRLCVECRVLDKPTAEELAKVGLDPDPFFANTIKMPVLRTRLTPPPPGMLFTAKDGGCARCGKIGYRGRVGIYELLLMDNEVRQLALKNADANTIKQTAIRGGMRTLREDGAMKVLAGVTTLEEVMMVTAEDRQ